MPVYCMRIVWAYFIDMAMPFTFTQLRSYEPNTRILWLFAKPWQRTKLDFDSTCNLCHLFAFAFRLITQMQSALAELSQFTFIFRSIAHSFNMAAAFSSQAINNITAIGNTWSKCCDLSWKCLMWPGVDG